MPGMLLDVIFFLLRILDRLVRCGSVCQAPRLLLAYCSPAARLCSSNATSTQPWQRRRQRRRCDDDSEATQSCDTTLHSARLAATKSGDMRSNEAAQAQRCSPAARHATTTRSNDDSNDGTKQRRPPSRTPPRPHEATPTVTTHDRHNPNTNRSGPDYAIVAANTNHHHDHRRHPHPDPTGRTADDNNNHPHTNHPTNPTPHTHTPHQHNQPTHQPRTTAQIRDRSCDNTTHHPPPNTPPPPATHAHNLHAGTFRTPLPPLTGFVWVL